MSASGGRSRAQNGRINIIKVFEGTEHEYYSKFHIGIVQVHPFWDGNGRIARLLANVPLLKAGLPPLTIPAEHRRTYIQLLANYQIAIGQLDDTTGVWPDESLLSDFNHFVRQVTERLEN